MHAGIADRLANGFSRAAARPASGRPFDSNPANHALAALLRLLEPPDHRYAHGVVVGSGGPGNVGQEQDLAIISARATYRVSVPESPVIGSDISIFSQGSIGGI